MLLRKTIPKLGILYLTSAIASIFSFPQTSVAFIQQSASVQATLPDQILSDADFVNIPPDMSRNIFASVLSPSEYNILGSVGVFGNLGVRGGTSVSGDFRSFIAITNNEFFNASGTPQKAISNFIIDGGLLALGATQGSTLNFELTVTSSYFDPLVGDVKREFLSSAELISNSPDSVSATFTGEDIGIQEISPTEFEIPLSFQSFEIGIVPPFRRIQINYFLEIEARLPNAPEGVFWEYNDPLDVSGTGQFPTISFTPVTTPPTSTLEPSTILSLLTLGGIALGASKKKQS